MAPTVMLAAVGDSKVADGRMNLYMSGTHPEIGWTANLGFGGGTAAGLASLLPAALAAASGTPGYVLLNIGANDLTVSTSQSTFETGLASVLDQLHTKWASATIGVALPWNRSKDAESTTMDDVWIPNVTASRPWAVVGPDERVTIKAADNGATWSADGLHPNGPGYARLGEAWVTELGILP